MSQTLKVNIVTPRRHIQWRKSQLVNNFGGDAFIDATVASRRNQKKN